MSDRGIENRALNAVRAQARSLMNRLVVVGGSLAGLRAVEGARKAGFAGGITLIGAERHLPYNRWNSSMSLPRCMTWAPVLFDGSSCLVDTRLFVQGREIVDGVEPASLISAEGEDL
jgi:hypothetical protein